MTALAWVIAIGIFVFLLFRFPKKTIGTVMLVIALAGIAFGWVTWQGERARAAFEREKKSIVTATRFDAGSCKGPAWPILVVLSNTDPTRTLNKVSFDLVGKRDGHSDSVMSAYVTSDKILAPKAIYGSCWSLPDGTLPAGITAADLNWTAVVKYPEWAP